ncbi:ATP-binding protein [Pyrofollis japonicus]|uniref:ATP-binding protein n=1 Tax=Pyrofollis japonicus TaxID=3060460 RepID=UPI00295A7654|nr:ATP-binding protein [Pyrofollis japonicus]BEP17471.1 ATP-binding protein [Pyrofollis japonicus]
MAIIVGVVLSGSTSSEARVQLTEKGEQILREGMLVVIDAERGREQLLARVDELRPVHEFYSEGDIWSEARRRGVRPELLDNIARRYMLASLTILGKKGPRGLEEPSRPPLPGDYVRLLEGKEIMNMLGLQPGEPGIIIFGELLGYSNVGAPLDVENITMHIGVFGETGSGKSYGVGYLLELLSSISVGEGERAALPALIIDANGDYLDYHQVFVRGGSVGEYKFVKRLVYPLSPARYKPYTVPITITLDVFTAREIAEFIVAYKSGGVELNELQVAGLERVLREFEGVYGFTELLVNRVNEVYEELAALSRGRDAVIHAQTARAIHAAIEKFHRDLVENYGIVSTKPSLGPGFVDELVSGPGMAILDFSAEGAPGVPLPVRQLVVAYLLRLLYKAFTDYKVSGRERYLLLVIEEAQNYAPNPKTYPVSWSLARDYLALIATQGRKFGISLLLVSQRPVFVDPVVASMINTWIVYRLPVDDVSFVSRAAGGLPKPLEKRLPKLPRGVALVHGQMNVLGFPVLVRTGKRKVGHVMGRTRVVETLRNLYSKKRS